MEGPAGEHLVFGPSASMPLCLDARVLRPVLRAGACVENDGLKPMNNASTIADCLTIEQIKARYASQWVVIADPVVNDALEVLSGRVVSHGCDRATVYQTARTSGTRDFACLYTGEPSVDTIFELT